MLTIKRAHERMMALLNSYDLKNPPPVGTASYLWHHMEELTLKKAGTLITQGIIPEYFYFLVRGSAYLKYYDQNGMMHVTRFYREDRFIICKGFVCQEKSQCSIVTSRDALLFRLSYADMKALPHFQEYLTRIVIHHSWHKECMREDLLCREPIDRVRTFYHLFPDLLPASRLRLDNVIAGYLNLSRSGLVNIRMKLFLELKDQDLCI